MQSDGCARRRGGLLAAHIFAEERAASGQNITPEYTGQLLQHALALAERLLPAFESPTGIPYGTVNLLYGVPPGESKVTSLAGAGTCVM